MFCARAVWINPPVTVISCEISDQIAYHQVGRESGALKVDLAIPAFGYKNRVSIDRHHGLIGAARNAAAFTIVLKMRP